MEVEIFTLCDFAQDNSGKLTIVGTFDTVNVMKFPTSSPPCALAIRLRLANSEAGSHTLKIRCVDEANVEIPALALKADFTFMSNPSSPYSGINLVLGMKPMPIERAGRLTFELYIDEEWSRAVPLTVTQNQPRIAA